MIIGSLPIPSPPPQRIPKAPATASFPNEVSLQTSVELDPPVIPSTIAKAFYEPSNHQSRNMVNGIHCLTLNSCDKIRLLSNTKNIVVVKFSHRRPRFNDFETFLLDLKFTGKFKISSFDKKHVFVEFVVFEDYVKLWMMGSSLICGFLARFFSWDSDFNPDVESFIAPVWIHLPGLPLYLFDEEAMLSLALIFGKPIFIDPLCLNHDTVSHMKLCVAMDVRVRGPLEVFIEFVGDGLLVDRLSQKVVYGVVPSFCSNCMHLGHEFGSCKAPINSDLRGLIEDRKSRLQSPSFVNDVAASSVPVIHVFDRLKSRGKDTSQVLRTSGEHLDAEVLKEGEPDIAVRSSQSADLLISKSDRLTAISLEPSNTMPRAGEEVLLAGESCLLSRVVDKADIPESSGVLVGNPGGKLAVTEMGTDSGHSTAQLLEPPFSYPGVVAQGQLVGDPNMLSKDESQVVNCLESGGDEQVFAAAKSADVSKPTGLLKQFSDSSVAPSLEPDISFPGAAPHSSLAGNPGSILKDDINTDQHLETAGEGPEIVAEISVDASPKANLVLSKVLNTSFSGTPGGSLEGISGNVVKWLGKKVGLLIQDNLQTSERGQQEKTDAENTTKVVIKHPVTKEVIQLTPKAATLVSSAPKSSQGLNKNAKKKWKKNQKKMALKKPSNSLIPASLEIVSNSEASKDPFCSVSCSPLPICVNLQQDWDGFDSNRSKDSAFWANYHAAQADLSQIDRPEAYPYMFIVDSEDEKVSSASDSQVLPTSLDTATSDSSLQSLDVKTLQKAYQRAATFIDEAVIEHTKLPSNKLSPPSVDVQISQSWADQVEAATLSDTSQESLDHLPLLEAYQKGHFDVQVEDEEATESSPLSFDELAGVPVTKTSFQAAKKYHKEEFKPP